MHLLIVRHCAEAKKVNKTDTFSACLKFIIAGEEAVAHVITQLCHFSDECHEA